MEIANAAGMGRGVPKNEGVLDSGDVADTQDGPRHDFLVGGGGQGTFIPNGRLRIGREPSVGIERDLHIHARFACFPQRIEECTIAPMGFGSHTQENANHSRFGLVLGLMDDMQLSVKCLTFQLVLPWMMEMKFIQVVGRSIEDDLVRFTEGKFHLQSMIGPFGFPIAWHPMQLEIQSFGGNDIGPDIDRGL